MNSAIMFTLVIFVALILVFTGFYLNFVLTTPPAVYPLSPKKYRIKEVVLKRGVSDYYVQYKRFFMWFTYKVEKSDFGRWNTRYIKQHFYDMSSANAKITELIGDRKRYEGNKRDKVKYHYNDEDDEQEKEVVSFSNDMDWSTITDEDIAKVFSELPTVKD